MSSQSFDQASFLRKKKEEILSKKKAEAEKVSKVPVTASPSTSQKPNVVAPKVPFANDGSFLERFKAMQKQQQKQQVKEEPKSPAPSISPQVPIEAKTELQQSTLMSIKKEEFDVVPNRISAEDDYDVARELAEKVSREGVQVEMMARIQGRNNPQYKFLFDPSHPVADYYQNLKENASRNPSKPPNQKKRWDDSSAASSSSSSSLLSSSSMSSATSTNLQQQQPVGQAQPAASTAVPAGFMSEFEKAKALVRAKAAAMMSGGTSAVAVANVVSEEEQRRQKEIEEQRMMNEIYAKVIQQQMEAANHISRKRKRAGDKPKYEYDSDEDIEGGTWEHKKRTSEMQKTAEHALELTDNAKGKHHLADFLPPDELEKFLEKVKAVKEGREADFSDYAKYKIGEDNIGFKMLMKAGWEEGTGLGSKREGITAPINKGKTSFDHGGLGTEKVAEVKQDDDDFDLYRKRMMLAYKFRPNPLNNPRRPYYS